MRSTTVAAVILSALLVAGCGASASIGTPEIKKADLEKKVSDGLTKSVGQRPDDISCPGDLDAKLHAKTRCVLTAGGDRIGVTVTVDRVDGTKYHLDIRVDDKPMS
ncbi:DUF4333 domain-containing protein [Nocardioides sp. KR10-350]|uniref:DUF4333 domain-containing protein n=1 Tax=Nocardioides cheoyonin TaxID=3156615 RepID=UPI0032B58FCA